MNFRKTAIDGVYVIDPEMRDDERGFFARAWCAREFQALGLETQMAQANICYSPHKGTLRGMHYQLPPHAEGKTIRCTRGAIYDVVIDLRPESPTYLKWEAVELSADNYRMLYVPPMFAHGYMTLTDDSEIFYLVSQFYEPHAEQGLRFNDPAVAIRWPFTPSIISDKDRAWDNLRD